ncbi:transglycosylase domain-containing protein [Candidatus Fermentibacterales bacterium]|nr:transglycosylase domain-containing protein [Candidatus Fermentibacterales bacterium]
MLRRATLTRYLITAVLTASCLLVLTVGAHLAARAVILGRLHGVDREARFSSLRVTPFAAVLTGVSLPAYGSVFDTVIVAWSAEPSLGGRGGLRAYALGGVVDAGCVAGRGEPGGRREGPARRDFTAFLNGVDCVFEADTMRLFARASVQSAGRSFLGALSSDAGSVAFTGRTDGSGCLDLSLVFEDLARVPLPGSWLPRLLEGRSYSGRLSGTVGPGLVELDGAVRSVDGQAVEVPVRLRRENGATSAFLSAGFENVYPLLPPFLASHLPGLYMEAQPSGTLFVEVMESDTIDFLLDAVLSDMVLYSPELAYDTLRFGMSVRCEGSASLQSGTARVTLGALRVDSIETFFDMDLSWRERERLRVSIWSDSLPGRAISGSIPEGALRYLRGLRLGGSMSFRVDLLADLTFPDSSDVEIDVDASRLSVDYSPISVGQYRWDGAGCRRWDSWGNTRWVALDTLWNDHYVLFDSLPEGFEAILCCAEDASFRSHEGFSMYHIEDSLIENLEEGGFARGGSTITMQLAKNLFLENTRVLSRKLEEVFLTWRLEAYLSKDRIVELYANVVEWGPDVFGIEEAAAYYFGIPCSRLSVRQVAYLVSILPGPRLYHRFFTRGQIPAYWDSYLDRLIRISADRGWLDRESASEALEEMIEFARSDA